MKAFYFGLVVIIIGMVGCVDDHCDNFVTYEERIPIITVTAGEYKFNSYVIYEDVMTSCDCLLVANERAKAYRLYLEGLDTSSEEFQINMQYPAYYSCK